MYVILPLTLFVTWTYASSEVLSNGTSSVVFTETAAAGNES